MSRRRRERGESRTRHRANNAEPGGDPGGGLHSVIDLIRGIQARSIDPSMLGHAARRSCVAYLSAEGYSVAEMAGILRASDRTIARDRAMLREEAAVQASPELLPQIVGRLQMEADATIGRLRRIGRDKDAPFQARVEAERGAWVVMRELVQSLQRLGYLPIAALAPRGPGEEEGPEPPSFDELQRELERLEGIRVNCRVSGGPVQEQLGKVKHSLGLLAAGAQLQRLAGELPSRSQAASTQPASTSPTSKSPAGTPPASTAKERS